MYAILVYGIHVSYCKHSLYMYIVHVRYMYVEHMRCFKHAGNNMHVQRAGYSKHVRCTHVCRTCIIV